ncbi:hypothetical protein E2C01_082921 [Portunus trituberculatus]|uniref:Uncharacterized protein n=1 Tax=Portunus trituberculatus TaxID=210409 RepID=A0A5B7IVT7_PORTR|nr:hypothetical protein [Portunus trituberculatus]
MVRLAKQLGVTVDDQLTWKLHVTGSLAPAYINYEQAQTTLSLPRLSARHREALIRLGRGLLRHSRLRHFLSPNAPRPAHATRQHKKDPSNRQLPIQCDPHHGASHKLLS